MYDILTGILQTVMSNVLSDCFDKLFPHHTNSLQPKDDDNFPWIINCTNQNTVKKKRAILKPRWSLVQKVHQSLCGASHSKYASTVICAWQKVLPQWLIFMFVYDKWNHECHFYRLAWHVLYNNMMNSRH